MEEQVQTGNQDEKESPILFTEEMQYFVYEAAKWARLLSIVGFVMIGFIIILAFSIGTIFTVLSRVNPELSKFPGGGAGIGIIYLLLGVLYFVPTLYLYQFASNAKKGINYGNAAQITESFSKIKSFFKFWGVFVLVILILYALIIISSIVAGVGLMSGMK